MRYTGGVDDEYAWRPSGVDLRDGLTTKDVIDALYAPVSLRMNNRVPAKAPTFMAVCAPTDDLRLIVIVCNRAEPAGPWTIAGARVASPAEQSMWRKYTS